MNHSKRSLAVRAFGFTAGLFLTGAAALAQQVNLQVNVPVGTTYDFQSQESVDLNMNMTMQGMGQNQQMQQQMSSLTAGSLKVLEVADGKPTKVEVTFSQNSGGQVQSQMGNQQLPFPLAGQTVTATIGANGEVSLQPAGNIDPATLQTISQLVSVDDQVFPGKPVGPGDTWQINAADMPNAQPGAQGMVNFRFEGVQNVGGREVAVIQTQTQMQSAEAGMQTRVEMAGPVLVDLQTGIAIKADLQGQMNITGQQQEQGMVVDIQGTGQMKTNAAISNLQTPGGNQPNVNNQNDNVNDNDGPVNPPVNPPAGNGPTGSYNGDGLTLTFNPDQSVTIELGGQRFQGNLQQFDGQSFRGQFNAGGSMFDFTGTLNGNNATFTTGNSTYNLAKQGGGNGGGGGNNPLG